MVRESSTPEGWPRESRYPAKVELTRTVRVALVPTRGAPPRVQPWNGAEGWHAAMEFEVRVAGTPDPVTGYLIGIDRIDACMRELLQTELPRAFADATPPAALLSRLRPQLAERLRVDVREITWRPHPFQSIMVDDRMPHSALLTQRFDFAASHRLHCADLSDESNRRIFGKCNNPAGHGHNYRLEVEVRVPMAEPPPIRATDLDRIVREHAVDRLDHKHLNSDVPAFAARNPSVEAIAQVCFEWLRGPVTAAGGELVRVRLWETEKTSAIFPG
jgi:6-pyruvoyltetrahydropterin/6-carboxytetrahydropterin synthase